MTKLKADFDSGIVRSMMVDHGFSLILLEVTFDSLQGNPDKQAQSLLIENFLCQLRKNIRHDDVIYTISLSKFAIFLKNSTSQTIMNRISAYFKKLFEKSKSFLDWNSSARLNGGCTMYPRDGEYLSDLMEKSEIALNLSKLQKGNEIYQWINVSEHVIDHQLSDDLIDAFERGELHLTFQPQIDLYGSNLVRGVEVFPAWDHPIYGKIPSEKIIELAESNGYSNRLGAWILKQAFRNIDFLRNTFGDELTLSIKMVSSQMLEKNFVSQLVAAAQIAQIQSKYIYLEIPEAIAMTEEIQTTAILSNLKAAGFKLSVGNYGINNFNFLHLRKAPLDMLKIDRSLVEDVSASEKNIAIIRCIINIAHILSLDIILDGVESFDQISTLYRNGCFVFQGVLTGESMRLPEIANWKARLTDITTLRERIYSSLQTSS